MFTGAVRAQGERQPVKPLFVLLITTLGALGADFRIHDGKLFNVEAAEKWVSLELYFQSALTNGVEGARVVWREVYSGPVRGANGGRRIGAEVPIEALFHQRPEPGPAVRVLNYRPAKALVDFERITVRAIYVKTVTEHGRMVEVYDCGRAATAAEVRAVMDERARAAEQAQQARAAGELSAKAAADARVWEYQQRQASNGLGGFQLELGRRYLRGDGCETNFAAARKWLKSALTNGYHEARNLLETIP